MHRSWQKRPTVQHSQPIPRQQKKQSGTDAKEMLNDHNRTEIRKHPQEKKEQTRIKEVQTGVMNESFAIQFEQPRPEIIRRIQIYEWDKRQSEPPFQSH